MSVQCSPTNGKNNCVHNWKYIEGELLLKRETLFVILKYLILHRTVKREGRVLPMIRISGKIGVYPYELALEISLGIDSGCRRLGTLAREKEGVTYGTPGSYDTKASLPKQHHHRGCLYYYRHTYLCVEHARIGGGGKR